MRTETKKPTAAAKAGLRHEYKYLTDSRQNALLKVRAAGILQRDSHAGKDGCYRIRSLYFDTPRDSCYYENESGIGERDKYRIRIYNGDLSRITLEKKSKIRQMTRKQSCPISEALCRRLMEQRGIEITPDMTEGQKQLLGEMQRKAMRPVVIVEYVRYPFVERNGNVRVTFDENICSSNEVSRFLDPRILLRPVLSRGMSVLEVKWDAFLPDYIKHHLQQEELQWSSFSKYYLCRKYNTYGGMRV